MGEPWRRAGNEYGAKLPEGSIVVTGVGDTGRSIAIHRAGCPAGPYEGGTVMVRPLDGSADWAADAGARLDVARVLIEAGSHALRLAADQFGGDIAGMDIERAGDAKAMHDDLHHIWSLLDHLDVQAHAIQGLPLRSAG